MFLQISKTKDIIRTEKSQQVNIEFDRQVFENSQNFADFRF